MELLQCGIIGFFIFITGFIVGNIYHRLNVQKKTDIAQLKRIEARKKLFKILKSRKR